MACECGEILELARRLYDGGKAPEVDRRSSVSRAYYAAFLRARDQAGISDTTKDVHRVVQEFYFQANKVAIANRLNSMRRARNKADYKLNDAVDGKSTSTQIKEAEAVFSDLE